MPCPCGEKESRCSPVPLSQILRIPSELVVARDLRSRLKTTFRTWLACPFIVCKSNPVSVCQILTITRFIDGICRLRNKGASISYYLHVFLRGGRLWLVVQQRVRLLLTFFWRWMLRSAASVVAGCTYGIIAIVASMA